MKQIGWCRREAVMEKRAPILELHRSGLESSVPLASFVVCKPLPCSCVRRQERASGHTLGPSPAPRVFKLSPCRQGTASGEAPSLLGRLRLAGRAGGGRVLRDLL